MRVILDSSVALTWCIPNQLSASSEQLLRYVKREGALVPPIWHLEIANILGLKLRDGNLSQMQTQNALSVLQELDVATSTQHASDIPSAIGQIIRFNLAVYDALYVELSLRTGLPLATFDKAMIASACRFGITVFPSV